MTYDDLQLLVAVVDERHFGRAARREHVSVSTLSRAIQRIEREAGTRVLERDRAGVRTTTAGQLVEQHARAVLAGWTAVRQAVHADEGVTGVLRLYCTVTAAETFVPALLQRFRTAFPNVRLDLVTGYASDAISRVIDGEVDVGVAMLPAHPPRGVEVKPITSSALQFVGLTESRPASIDWRRTPVVLPAHGLSREEADRWFRARKIRPVIAAEAEGHEAVLALVALGVGIGVVPSLVLEVSALRNRIAPIAVRPALPTFHIGVCARERALAEPVVRAFWATVEAER